MTAVRTVLLLGVVAALLAGCASAPPASEAGPESPTAPETTVTVYAAASLQRAFDEIAAEFTADNSDVAIAPIVYDGSSTLATQILEGAPAGVFASADEKNMQTVVDGLNLEPSTLFATNTLVIVVPADNPAGVTGIVDLADVSTVLCAPEVPCGAASIRLLEAAGVSVTAASLEQNVTAVLTKVALGEADAGVVYRTDISREPAVTAVDAEGADQIVNRYPITVLPEAEDDDAAQRFVDFVLGDRGQQILQSFGFGSPSE